jgi:hypothetical protein
VLGGHHVSTRDEKGNKMTVDLKRTIVYPHIVVGLGIQKYSLQCCLVSPFVASPNLVIAVSIT